MSDPTVPVLPLDVIENIIEILINDNPKGLPYVKAFSLVCQSFLLLCRKHIFSSIRMDISDSLEQLHNGEAFGQFLLETPDIARYVHRLIIWVEHPHSESGYLFDQVSQQLTRLQSLTFRSSPESLVTWRNISSSMRYSLLSLMRLPTLTHLDLRWIRGFLISDLITCTNLKHLSANGLLIPDKNDDALSLLSHNPIQLQVLDTILTTEVLILLASKYSDGRPVLDFTLLKKICIVSDWTDHGTDQTREILSGTQQLTDIRLTVFNTSFRGMEFAKTVTPSLQTLRRLHLAINGWEVTADPLADLCDELEKISGKNRLESIEIEIDLQSDEWGRLESIFLTPGWPQLTHVSLTIVIYVREGNSPSKLALESLSQNKFTSLASSTNLDFVFAVREEIVW